MNSNKINRDDRYSIVKITEGQYAVVNQDQESILTVSRTFDRACKHIMSSTGHYPRCHHEEGKFGEGMKGAYMPFSKTVFTSHQTAKEFGQKGSSPDLYMCEICGRKIRLSRLLARNIRTPKEYGPKMREPRKKLRRLK